MRIHHLALRVRDLEACKRFYRDRLGLEVLEEREDSVWLRAGDSVLMLETKLRGAGPEAGSGHLLALEVDSLSRWEQELARASIPIDDRTAHTLFLRDPEGHRVGLSVYPR